jgi:hypothetical protein
LERISSSAFNTCRQLKTAKFDGNYIVEIGTGVFTNCINLEYVDLNGTSAITFIIEQKLYPEAPSPFENTPSLKEIRIPNSKPTNLYDGPWGAKPNTWVVLNGEYECYGDPRVSYGTTILSDTCCVSGIDTEYIDVNPLIIASHYYDRSNKRYTVIAINEGVFEGNGNLQRV